MARGKGPRNSSSPTLPRDIAKALRLRQLRQTFAETDAFPRRFNVQRNYCEPFKNRCGSRGGRRVHLARPQVREGPIRNGTILLVSPHFRSSKRDSGSKQAVDRQGPTKIRQATPATLRTHR